MTDDEIRNLGSDGLTTCLRRTRMCIRQFSKAGDVSYAEYRRTLSDAAYTKYLRELDVQSEDRRAHLILERRLEKELDRRDA